MTVRELRERLAGFADDTPVCVHVDAEDLAGVKTLEDVTEDTVPESFVGRGHGTGQEIPCVLLWPVSVSESLSARMEGWE